MQKFTSDIVSNIPIRISLKELTDIEFETLMLGLNKGELNVLKKVYGNNYNEFKVIPLKNKEINLLLNAIGVSIPSRLNIIKQGKQVPDKDKEKTIYDYFKGYSEEKVNRAIFLLKPADYNTLLRFTNNNLSNPIKLENDMSKSFFYRNILDKIRRRIINPTNFSKLELNNACQVDEMLINDIIKFLNTKKYQELLNIFTSSEALCYSLLFGLIDGKKYDTDIISLVLEISRKEICKLMQSISYKLQNNMNISKEMTQNRKI